MQRVIEYCIKSVKCLHLQEASADLQPRFRILNLVGCAANKPLINSRYRARLCPQLEILVVPLLELNAPVKCTDFQLTLAVCILNAAVRWDFLQLPMKSICLQALYTWYNFHQSYGLNARRCHWFHLHNVCVFCELRTCRSKQFEHQLLPSTSFLRVITWRHNWVQTKSQKSSKRHNFDIYQTWPEA